MMSTKKHIHDARSKRMATMESEMQPNCHYGGGFAEHAGSNSICGLIARFWHAGGKGFQLEESEMPRVAQGVDSASILPKGGEVHTTTIYDIILELQFQPRFHHVVKPGPVLKSTNA